MTIERADEAIAAYAEIAKWDIDLSPDLPHKKGSKKALTAAQLRQRKMAAKAKKRKKKLAAKVKTDHMGVPIRTTPYDIDTMRRSKAMADAFARSFG